MSQRQHFTTRIGERITIDHDTRTIKAAGVEHDYTKTELLRRIHQLIPLPTEHGEPIVYPNWALEITTTGDPQ